MTHKRVRAMTLQARLVALFGIVVILSSVVAFKDPHNIFCGKDECYELLGLQRGAEKTEIKKAYREISKEVHPDKNQSPEAHERFTVSSSQTEMWYWSDWPCGARLPCTISLFLRNRAWTAP